MDNYDVAVWCDGDSTPPWRWEVLRLRDDGAESETLDSGLADSETEARSDAAAALRRQWEVTP